MKKEKSSILFPRAKQIMPGGVNSPVRAFNAVGGEPLSEGKNYLVASVHTRFQNNPLFGATRITDIGKVFVEELISYIRNNSPISSELDDRINLKTISFN